VAGITIVPVNPRPYSADDKEAVTVTVTASGSTETARETVTVTAPCSY
jgi:hypothetical protein